MSSFSEKIKEARMEKRLTLRELGQAVGKKIGYLADVERGDRIPDKETIAAIANKLGIEGDTLVSLLDVDNGGEMACLLGKLAELTEPELENLLARVKEQISFRKGGVPPLRGGA